MAWLDKIHHPEQFIKTFLKWGLLGLVGLFCCATNSPFASMVLSIEMFGGANLHLFALVCVICFTLSGHSGLHSSQIIRFNKASTIMEARDVK